MEGSDDPSGLQNKVNQSPQVQQLKRYQDIANSHQQNKGFQTLSPPVFQLQEDGNEQQNLNNQQPPPPQPVPQSPPPNNNNQIEREESEDEDLIFNLIDDHNILSSDPEDENSLNNLIDDRNLLSIDLKGIGDDNLNQQNELLSNNKKEPQKSKDPNSLEDLKAPYDNYTRRTLKPKFGDGQYRSKKSVPQSNGFAKTFGFIHKTNLLQVNDDLEDYQKHTKDYRDLEDCIQDYKTLTEELSNNNNQSGKWQFFNSCLDNRPIHIDPKSLISLENQINDLKKEVIKKDTQEYRREEYKKLNKLQKSTGNWQGQKSFFGESPGNTPKAALQLVGDLISEVQNLGNNYLALTHTKYDEKGLLGFLKKIGIKDEEFTELNSNLIKLLEQYFDVQENLRLDQYNNSTDLFLKESKNKTSTMNRQKKLEMESEKEVKGILPDLLETAQKWEKWMHDLLSTPNHTKENGLELRQNIHELIPRSRELAFPNMKKRTMDLSDHNRPLHIFSQIGERSVKEWWKDKIPLIKSSNIQKLKDVLLEYFVFRDQNHSGYNNWKDKNKEKRFELLGEIVKYCQITISEQPEWSNKEHTNNLQYEALKQLREEAIEVRNNLGKDLNVVGYDKENVEGRKQVRHVLDQVYKDSCFQELRAGLKPSKMKNLYNSRKDKKSYLRKVPIISQVLNPVYLMGERHESNQQKELFRGLEHIAQEHGNKLQALMARGMGDHYLKKRRGKTTEITFQIATTAVSQGMPLSIPVSNGLGELASQGINEGVDKISKRLIKKSTMRSQEVGNKNKLKRQKTSHDPENDKLRDSREDHLNLEMGVNSTDIVRALLIYMALPSEFVQDQNAHAKLCEMMNVDPKKNLFKDYSENRDKEDEFTENISSIRRKTKGFSPLNKEKKRKQAKKNVLNYYQKNYKDKNIDMVTVMLRTTGYLSNDKVFARSHKNDRVVEDTKRKMRVGLIPENQIELDEKQVKPELQNSNEQQNDEISTVEPQPVQEIEQNILNEDIELKNKPLLDKKQSEPQLVDEEDKVEPLLNEEDKVEPVLDKEESLSEEPNRNDKLIKEEERKLEKKFEEDKKREEQELEKDKMAEMYNESIGFNTSRPKKKKPLLDEPENEDSKEIPDQPELPINKEESLEPETAPVLDQKKEEEVLEEDDKGINEPLVSNNISEEEVKDLIEDGEEHLKEMNVPLNKKKPRKKKPKMKHTKRNKYNYGFHKHEWKKIVFSLKDTDLESNQGNLKAFYSNLIKYFNDGTLNLQEKIQIQNRIKKLIKNNTVAHLSDRRKVEELLNNDPQLIRKSKKKSKNKKDVIIE